MITERVKFRVFLSFIILVFFVIPYFFRMSKAKEITQHSLYAAGKITKKTGSLINGEHWHYTFVFRNKIYEDYLSDVNAFDIKVGNYFLVNFSSINPKSSHLLFQYRFKDDVIKYIDSFWTTIPTSILRSGYKE